jgi:chemotaxis protein methyltransferase CheR
LGRWPADLAGFHLVLCRNVMIYMTAPQQQILYQKFAQILVPGGFLALGLTETLLGKARNFYRCVDVRNRIYQLMPMDTIQEGERGGDPHG